MSVKTRPEPKELLRQMGPKVYREAYEKRQNLSGYLETLYPQSEYKDGMDAFSRICALAGIQTRSDPVLGLWAPTYQEAFDKSDNTRALFPEWAARQWRSVTYAMHSQRGPVYTSLDDKPGSIFRPYFEIMTPRGEQQLRPAIPLSSLVAMVTPIDTDAYVAFYINDDVDNQRMVRVGEGAEIPRAKMTAAEYTIRLSKFGRAIEMTYEQIRRMRIDKLAFHIQRMAIQSETDKVSAAIDVLINGDGNPGTSAQVVTLTSLDSSATPTTPTLKAWLRFKMLFRNPYVITTALGQEAHILDLLTLNTGNANVPLVTIQQQSGFGSFTPINPGLGDNVQIGWTDEVPANRILGMDGRIALEHVVEIGANIREVDRFITRQTEIMTMTEVEGFAILDRGATRLLDLSS